MRFQFREFGRHIFNFYEKYPLQLNCAVGATVYTAGDVICQVENARPSSNGLSTTTAKHWFEVVDWKRAADIGLLGAVENGFFMLAWYKTLNRFVGDSIATKTILVKCLLDQIFFATQQDLLFLGLCAYLDSEKLPAAVEGVKKKFLTTWIADCSVWPLVNFIGFASVPWVMQPTYMASVQFFWQIYISSVASSPKANDLSKASSEDNQPTLSESDAKLREIFDKIDSDKVRLM